VGPNAFTPTIVESGAISDRTATILEAVAKHQHEIRDPIHNFVRVTADEVAAINSRPFQRLRHIHQLALTYLVYPGATHRRFEHSLGVMELAGRVFDVITHERSRHSDEHE
jgi:HD superfamily phosphohydrolase